MPICWSGPLSVIPYPPASRQSYGKLYLYSMLGLCTRPCPSLGSVRQPAPHAYSHLSLFSLDPAHTGKPKSDSHLYPSALPWEPTGIGQELHDAFGAVLGPTKAHCFTEPSFTWAIRWSSRQRVTHWPASPSCPCSSQPSQPPTFPGQLFVNRAQASGSPPSLIAPGITSPRHTSSVPSHCWQCPPKFPVVSPLCLVLSHLQDFAWPGLPLHLGSCLRLSPIPATASPFMGPTCQSVSHCFQPFPEPHNLERAMATPPSHLVTVWGQKLWREDPWWLLGCCQHLLSSVLSSNRLTGFLPGPQFPHPHSRTVYPHTRSMAVACTYAGYESHLTQRDSVEGVAVWEL